MKKLLLIIAFLPLFAKAQTDTISLHFPYDPETGKIIYIVTEDVQMNKDELFNNAQTWFADTFKNYNSTMQLKDREAGKIIAKGSIFSLSSPLVPRFSFTLSVDTKDNKYRIKLYDIINHFEMFGVPKSNPLEENVASNKRHSKGKSWEKTKMHFNEDDEIFRLLLISLKTAITKKDNF